MKQLIGGMLVGVLLAFGVTAVAVPGMRGERSSSSTSGNFTAGGDVTATDDLISIDDVLVGDDVFVDPSDAVYLNAPSTDASLSYNGTNLVCTVPAAKGFSFVVNATEVANISSAGALQTDAGLTVSSGNVSITSGFIQAVSSSLYARATEYGHVYMVQNAYGGATYGYNMVANPNDGATAFLINTQISGTDNPLTSGNIMKFQNDDVDQATIDYGGRIQINMAGNAEPTCDSSRRGMLSVTQSGASVADILRICLKNASDTYAWTSVYTP